MGRKCVVPFCKSGYVSKVTPSKTANQGEKISVFQFPTNNELKKKWISAIPREKYNVSDNQGVC